MWRHGLYPWTLKHTLPALNPAELLALWKLGIFLLWQKVWAPPCRMMLKCWQEKMHIQWRARTLQRQVLHLWQSKAGDFSQTAVCSLECVTVDWTAALNVQDSNSAKVQQSDRRVWDDLEREKTGTHQMCLAIYVKFTYCFFLFLWQGLVTRWVVVRLPHPGCWLEGILPCEHRSAVKTTLINNCDYC